MKIKRVHRQANFNSALSLAVKQKPQINTTLLDEKPTKLPEAKQVNPYHQHPLPPCKKKKQIEETFSTPKRKVEFHNQNKDTDSLTGSTGE